MKTNNDLGLLIMRIVMAFTMLTYGINKLIHGISSIQQLLQSLGLPSFLANGVYVGEIIAPIMILFGYKVRLASLIFAFNCLMALLLTQTQNIFALNEGGGWAIEQLAIFIVIPVALFFTGSGKYSISRIGKSENVNCYES
ncbi:DoxX family protein [Ulvibacter sp. MAR_2010_11]|uniref:DoxX family protein n=1 Tax=Ulvibacter sp. MAR_2010_11 TaxID=1250229 RepID=UPI000C2CD1D1|nr:DoxX family protein [Ulvibacter sp. MAR_2010_11]